MALANTDLLLSEVHMDEAQKEAGALKICVVTVVDRLLSMPADDGEPPRRSASRAARLVFEHQCLTTVHNVALQLWRGAFLLSEFIVGHRDTWRGCTVVELGAGIGLVSTILARYADTVLCTDFLPEAVSLAAANVSRNAAWIGNDGAVRCRALDWAARWPPTVHAAGGGGVAPDQEDARGPFQWTLDDVAAATSADYYFGSDLVYDPAAVDALFALLAVLLAPPVASDAPAPERQRRRHFFMALEKRFNFEARSCSVRPYGYAAFEAQLCQDAWHWRGYTAQAGPSESPADARPERCPSCGAPVTGRGGIGGPLPGPPFAGRRVPVASFAPAVRHPSYDRESPALELWEVRRI